MVSVYLAPTMKVRRHHPKKENAAQSFATTQTIPKTLYALRDYMRSQGIDGPLSDAELASIRFRHLTPEKIADNKAGANVAQWWDGAWEIRYISDADRAEVEKVAQVLDTKQRNKYTRFGFCEQLPIA